MNAIPPLLILLAFLFSACSSEENSSAKPLSGEFIYRKKGETLFNPPVSKSIPRSPYPWEGDASDFSRYPKITKEFFRCKGSSLNPSRSEVRNGETLTLKDCGGSDKHSLPLIHGKEGVYPIQIELLNWLQNKTQKRVVITAGHRCPDHNLFVDPSPRNQISKHTIGAEVSFYVQGMEDKSEEIVALIQEYYKTDLETKGDKKYTDFKRYEKDDVDVSTPPWMNHEIYLKLYNRKEGRDFDNRHPYPYFSLQVRYDRQTAERVIYTWDKAYNNFLRH